MTKAGAAAEVADVRARVKREAAAAAAMYRATMRPAPDAPRIVSAVRLPSGWVSMQCRDGLHVMQPRYCSGA